MKIQSFAGTRGWGSADTEEDRKIIRRENIRLELSIKNGIERYGENKEIIVCMHYPPFNNANVGAGLASTQDMNFVHTMKKYNIKKCIYGHIHGKPFNGKVGGNIQGIEFELVSSDYLNFMLQML